MVRACSAIVYFRLLELGGTVLPRLQLQGGSRSHYYVVVFADCTSGGTMHILTHGVSTKSADRYITICRLRPQDLQWVSGRRNLREGFRW